MSLGDKFREFSSQSYVEQCKAFTNAYWDELQPELENLWKWTHLFGELDLTNKMAGCDLDEFSAHRFLEKVQETRTVKELREQLKQIDLDFNKRMALLEYLCYRFKKSVSDFVAKPQGDNAKEIEQATRMIEEVQVALEAASAAAAAAKEAEAAAKASAKAAAAAAAEAARTQEEATRKQAAATSAQAEATKTATAAAARAAEATAKASEAAAAEAEQRSALAEVQAQEDARNNKTKDLTAKSEDMNTGVVARNKAKNELAQHMAEDPLPLRRAKITLEAATKKAAKAAAIAAESKAQADAAADAALAAKKASDVAKAQSDKAKAEADHAKAEADETKAASDAAAAAAEESARAAEEALAETERKLAEAQAYLEEVKAQSGNGQGSIWWLQRELDEKKKFMPKSRGGTW